MADLKKALANYQVISRLEVDFKQTKILKGMKTKLESSGRLILERPGKVEWRVLDPQELTVILEPGKIAVTNAEGKTETFSIGEVGNPRDQRNLEDMLNWLKLDADLIAAAYDVTRVDATTLDFQAKRADSAMKKLRMKLTPKGDVRELKFTEASGDEMVIAFGTPKFTARGKP